MAFPVRVLALWSLLLPLVPTALRASPSATVSGTVFATGGTRLPGAAVTLTHQETGKVYRVVSGDRGIYRATGLPAGNYDLTCDLWAFQTGVVTGVLLKEGGARVVDFVLTLALTVRESVTVIGSVPRESVEASEVRESPARDVGEALSETAGVWKIRKGGIANDVVLRAFQGRDLSVLIDGQRIYGACPNYMDPPAFHVDFAEVERIDIGKGPFDVKNQGSLGGTVNIVTRRAEKGWHASAALAGGSFGFIHPSATLSYGSPGASVLAGYSHRRSDAYRDGSGRRFTELANYLPGAVDGEAFDLGTAWARLGWSPATGHQVQLSYTRQDVGNVYYPYLLMDAVYDDANRLSLRYDAEALTETITALSAQVYFTGVDHWMTDQYRTSSAQTQRGYSMGTLARTRTWGGRVETRVRDLSFGAEAYNRFWGASTEMARMQYKQQFSIPDVDMNTFGAFAEFERPLAGRFTLSVGGRLDRAQSEADESKAATDLYFAYHGTRSTSKTDAFASGKARLACTTEGGLRVSGGVGHTAQVPEPAERYIALRRMGTDWVGDPELSRSRNTGLDAAVALDRPGFYLGANFFLNWVDGFVYVYNQPRLLNVAGIMNANARSYANVDAKLWGGEVDAVVSLTDHIFVSGDLSSVRGTKRAMPEKGIFSEDLAEVPALRSRVQIRVDNGRLFAVVEGVASTEQTHVDADLKEETTPGYAIMNLRFGLQRGRLTVTAGMGNVLDKSYVEHLSYQRDPFRSGVRVPEPGRNLFGNVTLSF